MESDDFTKEVANVIFEFNANERRKRTKRLKRENELTVAGVREIGFEEGLQQGVQQGIRTTAKKMKEQGLSIEVISSITDLSQDEIEIL